MTSRSDPQDPKRVTGRDVGKGQDVTLMKSYPAQLSLWQTYLPGDENADDYSNTVELYDAAPKYFPNKRHMAALRESGKYLESLKRCFKHKGKTYKIKITPARIELPNGTEREYYPSWREELVEETLKKIACDQRNGVFLDDTAGVQFTLYKLRQELKSRGHEFNFIDLLTSLRICRGADIIISEDNPAFEVNAPIFPVLLLARRRAWQVDPKNTYCYVQFHPLITRSINKLAYRQFDYAKFMSLKSQLARWFLKRLSHNYIQASLLDPYRVGMDTIVRDSAFVNAKERRHKMRYIDDSLEELKEKNVLLHYEKTRITGKRNKIEDVIYVLTPHAAFVNQVKKANARENHLRDIYVLPQGRK